MDDVVIILGDRMVGDNPGLVETLLLTVFAGDVSEETLIAKIFELGQKMPGQRIAFRKLRRPVLK